MLGRVLERVSGLAYADYVRREVLVPSGIADMHITGNTLTERRPDEVAYTRQGSFSPYALPVARMNAHGGWIARPVDLLRFDGFAMPPDLLQPGCIATMATATTAPLPARSAGACRCRHHRSRPLPAESPTAIAHDGQRYRESG